MPKPDYDTTLARIAGNIAAGMVGHYGDQGNDEKLAVITVDMAQAIVDQIRYLASAQAGKPDAEPQP